MHAAVAKREPLFFPTSLRDFCFLRLHLAVSRLPPRLSSSHLTHYTSPTHLYSSHTLLTRLPVAWQAQYTEPPEGAAARLVATHPAALIHTTHHTPLISNNSSHTTHLSPVIIPHHTHLRPFISYHSSHSTHHTTTHYIIAHRSSHTTHLIPLIPQHSSHTTHLTTLILRHSSLTSHFTALKHALLILHHSAHPKLIFR